MARVTPDFSALNYGYISPKLRGRADLDFYDQALDYLQNYKVTTQGEASYREGSIFVATTKDNNPARLVPFIYKTEQAYVIEVTEGFMRFYKDNGLNTETPQEITGVTQADPAVLTYSGDDNYSNGDPIYLSGIGGMTRLNGNEYMVANVDTGANTFELQTPAGADVDTTGFDAYTSGGTVAKIVQIVSPFQEEDLFEFDFTQTEDTMYFVHADYAPQKLTQTSPTAWTIGSFDIISNPFGSTKEAAKIITGITKADPAVVTSNAHGYSNGNIVFIADVVGMTEVNKKNFTVRNVTANTFELEGYDSTDNDTYSSGGTAEKFSEFSYPSVVTLFDARLIYGASDAFPTRLWFSKLREDGELDDFTTGTLDSDAIIYKLRANQANRIRWIVGAENYMAIGTSGSEFRATGGGENNAITPTNISVKPVSFNGVAAVRPIALDSYIMYPQRNGTTVRSFEYNALQDGYTSPDRTLLADHIGQSKFKQFSYTAGSPNIVWAVRNDGKLAGLTFDPAQQVVAWHLHKTNGLYESIASIPDADEDDELWQVVTRTIDGVTRRSVEYVPNLADIPVFEDYFTGSDNEATDRSAWLSALWNVQKTLVHCDSALIYDGSAGASVGLTISGTLTVDETVTVTADGAFFTAAMATENRRIQSPNGGQIRIDTYNSSTEVVGTVLYDVESATLAAGEWYYMAKGVAGLNHLEGEIVTILADGGVQENAVVTDGIISLGDDAGYVIVGLLYNGIGKTEDVNGGSEIGSAMTKPRAITKMGVRVRASLGTKFGTSLYNLEIPAYREPGEVAGRPPHLVSGVMEVQMPDGWEEEKYIYWLHDKPVPSNIQYLQPIMETNDE